MGFFKEFKDDLSQAVNELLPEDELNQEDKETGEQIVNTLDSEETEADNTKMKEWLENFAQDDKNDEVSAQEKSNENADEMIEDKDSDETVEYVAEESVMEDNTVEKEEEDNMDDNVDLELLEALNSEEEDAKLETEKEEIVKEENKEKAEPKAKPVVAASDDDVTVITKGTTINGSISSDGSLDVMGTITGDVDCLGKLTITGKVSGNTSASEVFVNTDRMEGSITSDGSVKVGLGTVIIGDVTATSGVIAGAIKGEIDINGPIVIDSTAIIKGNIKAKSIQVNNGAVVEGFCSLSYANVDVDNIFE